MNTQLICSQIDSYREHGFLVVRGFLDAAELLAHGAGPNMTPHWRRAMTAGYMPDGSVFNGIQNILSDAQVAALEVGDPLDDERRNPLLWRRGA